MTMKMGEVHGFYVIKLSKAEDGPGLELGSHTKLK